jgi:hypothetical protein
MADNKPDFVRFFSHWREHVGEGIDCHASLQGTE